MYLSRNVKLYGEDDEDKVDKNGKKKPANGVMDMSM